MSQLCQKCGKPRNTYVHYDSSAAFDHAFVSPSGPKAGPYDYANDIHSMRADEKRYLGIAVAAAPEPKPEPRFEICPSCGAMDNKPFTDANFRPMRACGRCMIQWRAEAASKPNLDNECTGDQDCKHVCEPASKPGPFMSAEEFWRCRYTSATRSNDDAQQYQLMWRFAEAYAQACLEHVRKGEKP